MKDEFLKLSSATIPRSFCNNGPYGSSTSICYFIHIIHTDSGTADHAFDSFFPMNSLEGSLCFSEREDLRHKSLQVHPSRTRQSDRQLVVARSIAKAAAEHCFFVTNEPHWKSDVWLSQPRLNENTTPSQGFYPCLDARLRTSGIDDNIDSFAVTRQGK